MLKKWLILFSYLILCFNLQACTWWSQHTADKDIDWHNIHHLSDALYRTFPEAPRSHIQATYNHMDLSNRQSVSILKISMYLTANYVQTEQEKTHIRKKIRNLFIDWKQPNIECLTIHFSEHQSYFNSLSIPLKQVSAELICG